MVFFSCDALHVRKIDHARDEDPNDDASMIDEDERAISLSMLDSIDQQSSQTVRSLMNIFPEIHTSYPSFFFEEFSRFLLESCLISTFSAFLCIDVFFAPTDFMIIV